MGWIRLRRRRRSTVTAHYKAHKEIARTIITERLRQWETYTGYTSGRVAIRNQRSRWGSCSEGGNLNFSYKLIFLPSELMDYIIVHELCHTKELNHSATFWDLVGTVMPDYRLRERALRRIEKNGWQQYMRTYRQKQQADSLYMSPYSKTTYLEKVK